MYLSTAASLSISRRLCFSAEFEPQLGAWPRYLTIHRIWGVNEVVVLHTAVMSRAEQNRTKYGIRRVENRVTP